MSRSLSFKMLVNKCNFLLQLVENKCGFLTILLQQKLAQLWVFSSFRTGVGLRPKKCGAGGRGLGWTAGRVRAKFLKLLQVRGGCGQKNSTRAGL